MEHKTFSGRVELKGAAGTTGSVIGYASAFRSDPKDWDSDGEQVAKGAYLDGLPTFLNDGFFAVGHNWNILPVGTPVKAEEDEIGLIFEAEFHSTKEAQDARTVISERLDRKKTAKFSVGFDTIEDEFVDGGRIIRKAQLYEVSYVTVPADNRATIIGAKGRGARSSTSGQHGNPPGGSTGLKFAEHTEQVRQVIEEYSRRLRRIEAKHKARGNVNLSPLNRRRYNLFRDELIGIADQIGTLTAASETDPNLSAADRKAAAGLRADFLRLKAKSII